MGQGYQKFKRRMLRACLWRSILPGASLALAVFAALFTLHKRMIIPLSLLLCAAIGAGLGVLLFGTLFAALFPYKKRLARKLDRELALRQSVQTMLAFSEREDDIMVLQRQQTDAKLLALPAKRLKIKHVWTCLVCFVLAIGMSVTAFAIPAKQPEPPPAPVDPPFELGEWEAVALQELILEVQQSTMTEPAKGQTVTSLQVLLNALYQTKTESRMKALVVDTVMDVRDSVSLVVTQRRFSPIMSASGSPYTRELDKALVISDQAAFKQALDGIAAKMCEIKDKEMFIEAVHVFSEELKMALRNADTHEQDALAAEIERLSNALADVVVTVEKYTLEPGYNKLRDAFGVAYTGMGKAMVQQRYDADMGAHVESRLLEIFGMSAQDLPGADGEAQGPQTPGDYEDDDDDQTLTDGGLGSGELIVGSQDIIYDPSREDYVKYSEVIDIYNAIFLENKIDGVLSEEVTALIEAYFSALFSPSNKD